MKPTMTYMETQELHKNMKTRSTKGKMSLCQRSTGTILRNQLRGNNSSRIFLIKKALS